MQLQQSWFSRKFRISHFREIFAFREISLRFRFTYFCEISRKSLLNANENFRFVRWKPYTLRLIRILHLTINAFLPGFCFEKKGLHEVQLHEQTLLITKCIHLKLKLKIVKRKCLMLPNLDILNDNVFSYYLLRLLTSHSHDT